MIYGNIHAFIVQTVVYKIPGQFVGQHSSFFDQDVYYGYKAAFQWRFQPPKSGRHSPMASAVVRAYNGGLGAEPHSGSSAPGQGFEAP